MSQLQSATSSGRPLVSVCVPAYNHARFVAEAIESVLIQTYRPIELIIVDDGSSDGTFDICRDYATRYMDLVRLFQHPGGVNRGISATANLAFDHARGTYWCGMCSDDVLYPDRIELGVRYLEENRNAGWVYGFGDYIDENGQRLPGKFGRDITGTPNPLLSLIEDNVVPGMTVTARRQAMLEVGYHDEQLIYSDWDYWVRLLARYPAGFIPRSLVKYRIHGNNTSTGVELSQVAQRAYEVMHALKRRAIAGEQALAVPSSLALLNLMIARHAICIGANDEAMEAVRAARAIERRCRLPLATLRTGRECFWYAWYTCLGRGATHWRRDLPLAIRALRLDPVAWLRIGNLLLQRAMERLLGRRRKDALTHLCAKTKWRITG